MIEKALEIAKEKSHPVYLRMDALLVIVQQFDSEYFGLFEEILRDTEEHPDVRSAAALALGKIAGQRPLEILKQHCNDQDVTVRNYVVQALGLTYEEGAIPFIVQALSDKNNTIFASAAESLGLLGYKALPYLVELLNSKADDARCVAAWKLGELGDPKAVFPLVKTIRNEANVEVLALCIWALGEIGLCTDEVMEILTDARKKKETPDISLRAESAIKKIARHVN
jgi:HEAT repeat protein